MEKDGKELETEAAKTNRGYFSKHHYPQLNVILYIAGVGETEAEHELYIECRVPETNTSRIAYLNTSSHVFTGKELVNLEETFGINVSYLDNSTMYGEYEWRDENGSCVLSVSYGGDRIEYLNPDYLSLQEHDIPNKTEAVNLSLKYIQKIRGKINDLYLDSVGHDTVQQIGSNAKDKTVHILSVDTYFRQRINGLPVLGSKGTINIEIGANGTVLYYGQNLVADVIHPKVTHHYDPENGTNTTTGQENVTIISAMEGYRILKEYKEKYGKIEILRKTVVTSIVLAYYVDDFFSNPGVLYPFWIYHLKVRDSFGYGYSIRVNAVTGELIPPN